MELDKQEKVRYKEQSKITISDVAEALGISKTTVSRAISGKGRISEATRQRVMEYIEENHYRPSVVAKGLAQSKTFNIGWVIPGDTTVTDLPFFQRCMMGISEVADRQDYDIIIAMVFEDDISQLERVVRNHKVDGIILGRTLVNDRPARFLEEHDVPFVVVGSSNDSEVIQVDNDHINACRELTSFLVMKGIRRLALIGGSSNHVVNQTRYEGFVSGLKEQNVQVNPDYIFMDAENSITIERAVDDILQNNVECVICMDDYICQTVMNKLHRDGIKVPGQIKVASFYNSAILENNQPAITSLQYDPKELGAVACKTLFDYIEGKEIQKKALLSYEVVLKGSTQ